MAVLALLSLILLGPLAGGATGQRVVDTPELFGITSALVKGNALEVVKDDTLPPGLDLWFAGNRVTRASVKVGETFEVTDRIHVGHSFKLVAIKKGAAHLETTDWTAFLGRKPTRSTSTRTVRSYLTQRRVRR
jgi:hypothetical protein